MHVCTTSTGASYASARHVLIVCASTAVTPTVRRNVVLPDMFEPVMITPFGGPRVIEFATASGSSGCRSPVITAREIDPPAGKNTGRVHPPVLERYEATLAAASISPTSVRTR